MSEIIKYKQLNPALYDIEALSLKDFNAPKVKLFTEEDSRKLKKEAEDILVEANINAAKIVRDAKEEAQVLLNNAQKTIEERCEAGFQKGYEDGLKKAEVEMREKYSQMFSQMFENEAGQLKDFIATFVQSYTEVIKKSEGPLVKLALEVAEKVIKDEAARNNEVVLNTIKDGLSRLLKKSKVSVRVNPAQFGLVAEHKKKLISKLETVDDFELSEDPKVDLGGCIIDTPSGSIEARINKQVSEIKKVFTGKDKEDEDASGDN